MFELVLALSNFYLPNIVVVILHTILCLPFLFPLALFGSLVSLGWPLGGQIWCPHSRVHTIDWSVGVSYGALLCARWHEWMFNPFLDFNPIPLFMNDFFPFFARSPERSDWSILFSFALFI
jgi:hypothetical protein